MKTPALAFVVVLFTATGLDAQQFRLTERMDMDQALLTWDQMYPVYGDFLVSSYDCATATTCEIFMDRDVWSGLEPQEQQNVVLRLGESLSKMRGVKYITFISGDAEIGAFYAANGEGVIEH